MNKYCDLDLLKLEAPPETTDFTTSVFYGSSRNLLMVILLINGGTFLLLIPGTDYKDTLIVTLICCHFHQIFLDILVSLEMQYIVSSLSFE